MGKLPSIFREGDADLNAAFATDPVENEITKIKEKDPNFNPTAHAEIYQMENVAFKQVVPDRGFLSDVLNTFSPTTDGPDEFIFMAGLAALGAIAGHNFYIRGAIGNRIYPNLYILIVAPSTLYRKSTAISIAEKVVRMYDKVLVYPAEFTPEQLLHILQNKPYGLFPWKEFTNVLKNFNKEYNLNLKELFQEFYDVPQEYRRELRSSKTVVEYPATTIIAACPISLLNESSKTSDFTGGFFARFIYVPVSIKIKPSLPWPPAPDKALLGKIQDYLNEQLKPKIEKIRTEKGEHGERTFFRFEPTDEAKQAYSDWHVRNENLCLNQPNEDILASFYSRIADYAKKFAMLYQISFLETESELSDQITLESMNYGLKLADYLRENLKELMLSEMITEKGWFPKQEQNIIRLLKKFNDKVLNRKLQQYSKLESTQYHKVIKSLIETEQIKKVWENKSHFILLNDNGVL